MMQAAMTDMERDMRVQALERRRRLGFGGNPVRMAPPRPAPRPAPKDVVLPTIRSETPRAQEVRKAISKTVYSFSQGMVPKKRDIIDVGYKPKAHPEARIEFRQIIAGVEARHKIAAGSIVGHSRVKAIVRAREEAIYVARKMLPHLSYPQLALKFNKDHSSLVTAFKRYEERIASERQAQDA